MPDPTLELRDVNGTLIVENDNWRGGPELEIQGTTLAPAHDLESAVVTTLPSGPYTAVIRERNGQSGVGLVEVIICRIHKRHGPRRLAPRRLFNSAVVTIGFCSRGR